MRGREAAVPRGCPPRLLGVRQAARYLGVKWSTVYELYACGKLRRVRRSLEHQDVRWLLFDRHDLDALIERGKAGAAAVSRPRKNPARAYSMVK
jgi:predicted DNA-binding transcriptional regulator AlpA